MGGLRLLRVGARRPPAATGWPCTPSSPAHGRPVWRSSTWTADRAELLPGSEDATPTGGQPSLGWASNGWLFLLASGPTTTIGAPRPGQPGAGLVWVDRDQELDTIPRALAPN